MSFDEKILALTQRLPKITDHLTTEEATKNALVLPFISALGYDVFNPQEVIPEFTADIGTKKGEKVDYAIVRDGEIILIIECKKAGTDLSQTEMNQLFRYFSVTKARIAILTNGIQYRLFSDLDAPNKMDTIPFLELDLQDIKPNMLSEVKKLVKENFDLDLMLSTANELKYTAEFKRILINQLDNPEEDFVRFLFSRTYPHARFTASAKEQSIPLVLKAFTQLVSEKVSDRLRTALQTETKAADKKSEAENIISDLNEKVSKEGIFTTEEELEGYRIVRAILSKVVHPNRVAQRDSKTYFGVLLDDNNRKPICRLWFNSKQKYLGVLDKEKNETRIPIDDVTDIYIYSDKLIETVERYEQCQKISDV